MSRPHLSLLAAVAVCCILAATCGISNAAPAKRAFLKELLRALQLDVQERNSCTGSTSMNDQQKNGILKAHNEKRKIAKAVDMPDLVWNDELAGRAQEIADKNAREGCEINHDLTTDCPGQTIGQNLASYGSSDSNIVVDVTKAVKMWYDEVKDYSILQPIDSNNFYDTGHYTQVMWSATTEVGCGYSTCKSGQYYNVIIACDYREAGNMVGESPFQCPPGASFSNGVCAYKRHLLLARPHLRPRA